MCIISCIGGKKKDYKQFVQNRVIEIRKNKMINWKLVDTNKNPADDVSRGLLLSEIVKNVRWQKGSHFLSLNHSLWPNLKPGDNFSSIETVNLFVGTEFEYSKLKNNEKNYLSGNQPRY